MRTSKATEARIERARSYGPERAEAVAKEIHDVLAERNGSASMTGTSDGRVTYHAHVTIGDDEYLVSMVPLRLDEEEDEG